MLVRWDAVVQANNFWSESTCRPPGTATAGADRPVCVQVWLFGSLNDKAVESPVAMEFHAPFSVRDVIAELGHLFGRAFLDRLTDSAGVLLRTCRVFVNGQTVDDVAAPIETAGSQTEVELIVLTAAEGG